MSTLAHIHRDLRAEVAAVMVEDKLSQAEIRRQSGVSDSAISQWLNGRYPGDNERLEAEIARWFDAYLARKREQRALPLAPVWVATPSGERILSALGYAQLVGDVAVIYGGAGLGKTRAIEQYQRTNPNVWIATMTTCTKAAVPALEEIAIAMGLDVSGGAARLQRAVVKRMRGTQGLLVIDEAQHLSVEALDAVRALHDADGIGVALVGNESVYARMTGGNRAAYLDRLYSRIGKRVRLTRSSQGDIDALIDAWGIDVKNCRATLHEIAKRPGGLRGMTKVLRLASMFAAGAKRPVSCTDIKAAWRDLEGE